jgi:hypothetical protein
MSYARIRQLKDQSLSIDQGSLGGRTKMSDPPRTDIATIDTKDKQAASLDYGGAQHSRNKRQISGVRNQIQMSVQDAW